MLGGHIKARLILLPLLHSAKLAVCVSQLVALLTVYVVQTENLPRQAVGNGVQKVSRSARPGYCGDGYGLCTSVLPAAQ